MSQVHLSEEEEDTGMSLIRKVERRKGGRKEGRRKKKYTCEDCVALVPKDLVVLCELFIVKNQKKKNEKSITSFFLPEEADGGTVDEFSQRFCRMSIRNSLNPTLPRYSDRSLVSLMNWNLFKKDMIPQPDAKNSLFLSLNGIANLDFGLSSSLGNLIQIMIPFPQATNKKPVFKIHSRCGNVVSE